MQYHVKLLLVVPEIENRGEEGGSTPTPGKLAEELLVKVLRN